MSRKRVLWLIPVLLALHNLEEAVFMPPVLPIVIERIPTALRSSLPLITYPQFLIALVIVTVVPFLVAASGRLDKAGGAAIYVLLAVQAVLALNVLFHLGSALMLGSYAPGLVTALLVNLPFSIYVFGRATREHWFSGPALLSLIPLALLIHGPGLVGLLVFSRYLSTLF